MKRIKISSKMSPKIRHSGAADPLVDPKSVVSALGGEPIGRAASGMAPPAMYALREEIINRLASTGGRPALEGTARRQKIPLNDEDWSRLLDLARRLDQDRLHPTPGQVASVLLHISLTALCGTHDAAIDSIPTQSAERFYRFYAELLGTP